MSFRRLLPFAAPLLAVALGYLFYTGLFCSDDTRYMAGIQKIVDGRWIDLASNAERRLVFLLPAVGSYWLSGQLLDFAIIPYALFYVGLPVLAWLAVRQYGCWQALLASLAVAMAPLFYLYAGAMLPDVSSAFVSAAMLVLLMHWQRNKLESRPNAPWTELLLGALAMWGIAIKESNAVIAPIPFVVMGVGFMVERWTVRVWRPILLAGCGAIAFMVVEAIAYKLFSGQWHVGLQNSASSHGFKSYMETQGRYPLERWSYLAGILDKKTLTILLVGLTATVVMLASAVKEKAFSVSSEWVLPTAFFLWPLIYFSVGTSTFKEYIPPIMQARYFAPCVFPAIILIHIALARNAFFRSPSGGVAIGSALAMFLLVGVGNEYNDRGVAYWARAKDSYALALADVKASAPGLDVLNAGEESNSEITRCRALLLRDAGYTVVDGVDYSRLDTPFLLTGIERKQLGSLKSPLGREIERRIRLGEWQLGLVGYYFADADADNRIWWLPRQAAVAREFRMNPLRFKEKQFPSGYVPWMKREMHTELYQVTSVEKR